VNRLWFLYTGYVDAYDSIWRWLCRYTTDETAGRIARRAMANLFRWACNAVQTTQGPWADAAELALAGLTVTGFEGAEDPSEWPLRTLPALEDGLHYRLCHLYALIYAMQYEAGWTVREREEIFVWIMSKEPVMLTEDQLEGEIDHGDLLPLPLRRAVEISFFHTCDGALICAVTDQMWRDEHASSRTWMLAQKSREAIAPWPR